MTHQRTIATLRVMLWIAAAVSASVVFSLGGFGATAAMIVWSLCLYLRDELRDAR